MFIIKLTYTTTMDQGLRLLPAHQLFLDKYYETGNFIASGPQVPRTGGVILCRANDRNEVAQIIKEDPLNEIADYLIAEFEVNKYMDAFEPLLYNVHKPT